MIAVCMCVHRQTNVCTCTFSGMEKGQRLKLAQLPYKQTTLSRVSRYYQVACIRELELSEKQKVSKTIRSYFHGFMPKIIT